MKYDLTTGRAAGAAVPEHFLAGTNWLDGIRKWAMAGVSVLPSLALGFTTDTYLMDGEYAPNFVELASHSRASKAWEPNWDGKSGSEVGWLKEYQVDERRVGIYGPRDEGAATNQIRNPRGEGGDASTLPTNWNISGQAPTEYAYGSENGWPYVDVTYTAVTPSGSTALYFEQNTQVSALGGEDWTTSFGVRLVSGSLDNVSSINIRSVEYTSGGDVTAAANGADQKSAISSEHRRLQETRANSGGGTTAHLKTGIIINHASGSWTFTLRIYAPQLEQSATPTSPILPTAGTPAAATRAADVVTGVTTDRASRGWYDTEWDYTNGGVCGDLLEFLPGVPRVGPKGLLVEEGTTNHIRNPRFEGGTLNAEPTDVAASSDIDAATTFAYGVENGRPYWDIIIDGNITAGGQLTFENLTQVLAASGQSWTFSVGIKVLSGSASDLSKLELRIREGTAALGFVRSEDRDILADLDGQHRRFFVTVDSLSATTERVGPQINLETNGSVQLTLRIYAPQLEQKAYPTSVVLPEAGSPAAATRAAEDSLEIDDGPHTNAGGAFSALIEGAAPSVLTLWPSLMGVGADNANQALFTKNASGNDDWYASLMAAGVQQLTYSSGPNGADSGVPIRFAVRCAENDVFYARNIGGLTDSQADTSASVNHLTAHKVSLGSGIGNPARGCMFITAFRYWPLGLADSQLEALVA